MGKKLIKKELISLYSMSMLQKSTAYGKPRPSNLGRG